MPDTVRAAARDICVYVRKGKKGDERTLGFARPADVPQTHILTAGMALDGNAVICGVAYDDGIPAYAHPNLKLMERPTEGQRELANILNVDLIDRGDDEEAEESLENEPEQIAPGCSRMGHRTLAEALNCVQAQLAIWLYAYGYNPIFE